MQNTFPDIKDLFICFAHVSYQMEKPFKKRNLNIKHAQAWSPEELSTMVTDANILVISGLWDDELLKIAPKLRFIQSISAGYNQYSLQELRKRNIRLASASGVNKNAVSEHAMALILGFTRHLSQGKIHQGKHHWRGLITNINQREHELGGMTMLIVGLGTIGSRVAQLAKAFGMKVLATKRHPDSHSGMVDEVHKPDQLPTLIPQADFVVLTCLLTPETEHLINRQSLSLMKESAYLINVARGNCVDEQALLETLTNRTIAGAGLDCFIEEPLPSSSPFWDLDNVMITPHSAGECQKYEDNVIDILLENLNFLSKGEDTLLNQVI